MTVIAGMGGCSRSRPPRPTATVPNGVSASAMPQAHASSVIAQDAATLQWSWLVGRAENQLVAQCMKGHGFAYPLPAADPEPDAETMTADALGSGAPPTYGVFPHHDQPSSPGADQVSFRSALEGAPTAVAAMTLPDGSTIGYETGGCTGQARTGLFGSVRAYVASAYVPQVVRDEFNAFLATDGRYTTALKDWQSCMTDRQWSFDSPSAAISSLETAQLDAASLGRRQAAIAAADRDCDSRSHLRANRGNALTQFTADLSGQVLAQLDSIYAARGRAGQVARRALSS
ncbi:hypothetical protein [Rugosimonospora africana]|nr:hypothetical protein [Rugosimonospora africana]